MLTTKCSARAHSLMLCQGEVMRKTRDKAVWSNSMYYKFMIQAWVWDIAWLQIYGLTNQGNLSNIIGLQIILMDKFKWEYQNPSFHQFIAGGMIVETWLHQRKTRVFGRKQPSTDGWITVCWPFSDLKPVDSKRSSFKLFIAESKSSPDASRAFSSNYNCSK